MGFHGGGWFAFIRYDEEQDQPHVTRELLRRVWEYARPYKLQIVVLIITVSVISGLSLIPPLLYKSLIDTAIPEENFALLNLLALGMIIVPILNGLIGVAQRNLSARVGEGIIYDLRRSLYGHMQRMSLRFFTETRTGELMSRLNNDVIGAQRAVTGTMLNIVSNTVSVLFTLGIMLVLDWRLTLISLVILPIFIVAARSIARRLRLIQRQSLIYSSEMNATMNETLNVSGALLVKLFGRERYEMSRFSKHATDVRDIGVRSATIGRWFMLILGGATAVGTALVFWLGGQFVLRDIGGFTLGTLVAFGAYLTQLYGPLTSLTNAPVEFATSMVSFERVFEVLDIPIEIVEKPDAKPLPAVQGRIEFSDVTFSYTGDSKAGLDEVARFTWGGNEAHLKRGKARDSEEVDDSAETVTPQRRNALDNISFTIEPGQLVALVGPSGAGKTSVTYLIPRLYDPQAGSILIDGIDIRDIPLESLAENIGMVTQETYLFYDTIRANLLYARPDASDADLVAAAKAANIHEFVMSLPDRYDTVVGERGYRLSGGERQRMAIARVLLKNPRILVLDEATSSLDSLSEALIQEALARVMQGRSSLVIAHRLSTVLSADTILVLDQGRIVERGTHADLLAQDGLYATIYRTQFEPEPTDSAELEPERIHSATTPIL
ncbi:MAG: ABC transporter ATP-binding protein/permease [Anaerolineae bacterium]|nr:ABC transporter ATP-binding protein/permease [Anaerolineae bacterium]